MVLEGYYDKSFLPYERVEHVPDLKELIRIAKTCWASNPEAPRLRRTPSTTLPQLLRDFTDLRPRDVFLTACKIEEQIRDHLRKLHDLPDWYDLPEHRDKVLPPWRIRQMSQEPETASHDPPQPTQGTQHAPTAPKERQVHPWKQQSNLLPRMLNSSFSALAQSHDCASLSDPILYRRRLQRVGKALPYLYADHSVSRRVSYTSALLQDLGPRRRIVLKQRKPLWFLYGRNGVLSQRFRPHKEHLEAPTASPHYTIVPAPEPGRTQDDAHLPPGSAVEIVPRDPRTTHFVPVRTKQKQLQDEVYRHALHPRASATTRPEHDLAAEQGLRDPASSRGGLNRTVSHSIRIASLRARGVIDERFAQRRSFRRPLLNRTEQTPPHDAYAPRHRAPVSFVNTVQAPPLQTTRLADEYQELKDAIQKAMLEKAMLEKAALEKVLRDAEPRPGIKAAETWQAPPGRRRGKRSVAHEEKRREWW
ncbi:hypothetical protein C7974DRAFT_417283 [Boeremia exigua]|uniref:uncharacterized protein n=1 Tax=Boeremia exigua TaxID=749465 RepID=UPI001E8DA3A0|nr:uncharacterized protein C7974DRAFT_417283 [Boeremia exigua]KAH6615083.1 hypothetical protein C7974DRAFT_417283 [Boeremia exigua]